MQRWDYCIIYKSEHVESWIRDGKPAPELGKMEDTDVLRRLGQEGWELVAVVAYTYFLKRPIES